MTQAVRVTGGLQVDCERCGGAVVLTKRVADLELDGDLELRVRGWEGWCPCGASLYFSACWPRAVPEVGRLARQDG